MSGLEVSLKRPTDFDADLRAIGTANVVSGAAGCMPGFPMVGETLLARRFALSRWLATGAIAGAGVAGAVLGTEALALLPRGVFAVVIGYLGLDLLATWLRDERRAMAARDTAIVWLILAVAAMAGFLEAVAAGFILAALLFVQAYATLDPVRARSSLAARRSRVERPVAATLHLTETGEAVAVIELTGYLFFGSAHRLGECVRAELARPGLREIIVDLSRVQGVDSSALKALMRIAAACDDAGVAFALSALPAEVRPLWPSADPDMSGALQETLDDALFSAEERLLARGPETTHKEGLLADLEGLLAEMPEGVAEIVTLANGEELIAEGSVGTMLYVLRVGCLRAEIGRDGEAPFVVARYRPGALVGEIAVYGSLPRTASVFADGAAEVLRVDPERLQAAHPLRAAELHRMIAAYLAHRLARTTKLLQQISA